MIGILLECYGLVQERAMMITVLQGQKDQVGQGVKVEEAGSFIK